MKLLKNAPAFLACLTALNALTAPPVRAAGGESSGGGDQYVHDFVQTVTNEIYPLLKNQKTLGRDVKAEDVLRAADPRRMLSEERVYESCDGSGAGREVEACYNAQTDLFHISRSMYPLHRANSPAKRALIAHELFRRMGLEGDGYEQSSKLSFYTPTAEARDYLSLRASETYLREFPSMGVDQIILASAWYRVDQAGAKKAKTEVLNFLKDNLTTGPRKDLIEKIIEFETRTGCDKQKDYPKRKERHTSSGSYSYSGSSSEHDYADARASAGYASRSESASASASARTGSSSSSSERSAGTYYEDVQIEEREIYCEIPRQWIRAVLKATTQLQALEPKYQNFLISQHVHRTFEKLNASAEEFLNGIDNIILMPAITPYALKSKFQQSGSALLQSWVGRKLAGIETGRRYSELLRKLFDNFEYEAAASQFESLAKSIADRASQVESPGVFALIPNEEGIAQPVLVLSRAQLNRIDPNASFQGVVPGKSRLTPEFVNKWEQSFKCDIGFLALYDSVKHDPVRAVMADYYTSNDYRLPLAAGPLKCTDRYTTVKRAINPFSTSTASFLEDIEPPLIAAFKNQGCIPIRYTHEFRSRAPDKASLESLCPLTTTPRQ
ncbi:MAG: hypothetical protein NDJ89_04970 [Oligoflexia bacterium]|nr:hypothetical protein [Oligoflexia bacterium]